MKQRVVVILSIATCVALAALLVISRTEISRLRGKVAKHDQRCQAVRIAMRMDARELADPKLQAAASLRFAEAVADHSLADILGCVERPVDLSKRETCLIKQDFNCLAELALAAEQAIPRSE